jgi:hypothetical protein
MPMRNAMAFLSVVISLSRLSDTCLSCPFVRTDADKVFVLMRCDAVLMLINTVVLSFDAMLTMRAMLRIACDAI